MLLQNQIRSGQYQAPTSGQANRGCSQTAIGQDQLTFLSEEDQ